MIKLANISKNFGQTQAVKDLSLTIEQGEVVGLLGPNGAGKTTTMRLMSGYLFPDQGEVQINDVSVLDQPTQAQQLIGYLPENNPLYSNLLVKEFLQLSASFKHMDRAELNSALEFAVPAVGIESVFYQPINELSKGFRQRVGIAAALLNSPQVLILDEPTEGLDPNQRSEIRQLLLDLAQEHTVLISTHVMQEVTAICNRILIINQGQLVADGSEQELKQLARGQQQLLVELALADQVQDKNKDDNKLVKQITAQLEQAGLTVLDKQVLTDSSETIEQARLRYSLATSQQEPAQPILQQLASQYNWVLWRVEPQEQDLESIFAQLTN